MKIEKKAPMRFVLMGLALLVATTGCSRASKATWEDTRTTSKPLNRQGKSSWQKGKDPRVIYETESWYIPQEEEFIPLQDEDLQTQYAEKVAPQPKAAPPKIDQFDQPHGKLSAIFENIFFNTDQHVPKAESYYQVIGKIADYLQAHPKTCIFVEGHCDERASEAYNLALGTRRCNFVRHLLIKEGANPKQIYTISFGKERPIAKGHDKQSWAKNRRVEFKICEQ